MAAGGGRSTGVCPTGTPGAAGVSGRPTATGGRGWPLPCSPSASVLSAHVGHGPSARDVYSMSGGGSRKFHALSTPLTNATSEAGSSR